MVGAAKTFSAVRGSKPVTITFMLKTGLELYSAAMTAFSVGVSVIALRSGGPKISVRALLINVENSKRLLVEIYNNGRADATIDILGIELSYVYGSSRYKERLLKPEFEGSLLPYRLEGNSFDSWQTSAKYVDDISNLLDPGTSLRVVLQVGGRRPKRRIKAKITKPIVYESI
jgi:hypothetical protein